MLEYIAKRNPTGARNVQERIKVFLGVIVQHPETGRTTATPGLRRIALDRYPYAIFYRVGEDEVIVSAIRHTSRRPAV